MLGDRMAGAVETMSSKGITVLIVEHNLPFVERRRTRVNVMQLGTTIAAGTMAEMRQHPEVIDAYLGEMLTSEESILHVEDLTVVTAARPSSRASASTRGSASSRSWSGRTGLGSRPS